LQCIHAGGLHGGAARASTLPLQPESRVHPEPNLEGKYICPRTHVISFAAFFNIFPSQYQTR
jgi:hypothetical protein